MKKLVEIVDGEGLEALLGERVLLMCANYFYAGILTGVNESCVCLKNPSIVYQTGAWTEKAYADEQKLGVDAWYVQTSMIESFGKSK